MGTSPAIFVPDQSTRPRPTMILCGGGDGSGEELYFMGGREVLDRGYNALVFHGPGHRGALHRNSSLVFRADYEVPLRAVVDYALSRPDVDPQRLALTGLSQGGYLASRAAATDPRIRAFIPNSPVVDMHRILTAIVETKLGPLPAGAENVVISFASRFLPKPLLEYVCWTYGVTRITDYLEANKAFKLGDLPQQIICPTLCLHSEGEGEELLRQTMEFYDALRCPKQLHIFTVAEGADTHCQLNNISRSHQVIFDWLDEIFGTSSAEKVQPGEAATLPV